ASIPSILIIVYAQSLVKGARSLTVAGLEPFRWPGVISRDMLALNRGAARAIVTRRGIQFRCEAMNHHADRLRHHPRPGAGRVAAEGGPLGARAGGVAGGRAAFRRLRAAEPAPGPGGDARGGGTAGRVDRRGAAPGTPGGQPGPAVTRGLGALLR